MKMIEGDNIDKYWDRIKDVVFVIKGWGGVTKDESMENKILIGQHKDYMIDIYALVTLENGGVVNFFLLLKLDGRITSWEYSKSGLGKAFFYQH